MNPPSSAQQQWQTWKDLFWESTSTAGTSRMISLLIKTHWTSSLLATVLLWVTHCSLRGKAALEIFLLFVFLLIFSQNMHSSVAIYEVFMWGSKLFSQSKSISDCTCSSLACGWLPLAKTIKPWPNGRQVCAGSRMLKELRHRSCILKKKNG